MRKCQFRINIQRARDKDIILPDDTIKIWCSNGEYTLIDKIDYDKISNYRWHCWKGYVWANGSFGKNRFKIYLHRFIIEAANHDIVDHINRDTRDNRRENLRKTNKSINNCNSYWSIGVHQNKQTGKWVAQFRHKNLGSYIKKEDARIAYILAKEEYLASAL